MVPSSLLSLRGEKGFLPRLITFSAPTVTWRTPWSGQLTIGAENVVTRGKNPFAPRNESTDEGTVPYVRYEQDL